MAAGLAFSFCMPTEAAAVNKTMKADVQAISIPAGTTLKLEIIDPVSTKIGNVGDEFSAMLKEDKIVKNKIALPAGSIVRGTISRIVPAKRLSRSAVLYLNFDHVVTPTGRQIPLSAGLYGYAETTDDGGIYQNGNYGYAIKRNWQNTKKLFKTTIDWGKNTGDNLQYLCVPVAAFGGAVGGAGYYVGMDVADLFRKGNDVNLPQGLNFDVMLVHSLEIPLH